MADLIPSVRRRICGTVVALLTLSSVTALSFAPVDSEAPARAPVPEVTLLRTPDGGIQPQVVTDEAGTVHLLYYKGEAAAGDLYYARRAPGADDFSAPLRVNARPGSAIAAGTIRGGQMAVGADGRVHVVWNGSGKAGIEGPGGTPLLYTHLDEAGTGFLPERNVITWAGGLDGGSSVAADGDGNVYVVWHGGEHGAGEAGRAVYLARSQDGGETFERERRINPEPTGVCACCGLRAHVDADGGLYVLYRGADEGVHRDVHLLASRDGGERFTDRLVDRWELEACPMSSAAFADAAEGGVWMSWQTENRILHARAAASAGAEPIVTGTRAAPGTAESRKYPALAVSAEGPVLVAWAEGAGWARGGRLAWQLYGADGQALGEPASGGPLDVWSFPAAYAEPDGDFVVLY